MSLSYQCDVFCDVCANWIGGDNTGLAVRGLSKQAKRVAKDAGWVSRKSTDGSGAIEHVCPECQKHAAPQPGESS